MNVISLKTNLFDFLKKTRTVLSGSLSAFKRNNGLTAASSLAFSAMLALIPTLFLLTSLLSMAIGSSSQALARTQDMMTKILPAYSQDIMKEVRFISSHMGTIGLVNVLVLFWTLTPFVADMRLILGTIFRKKAGRPFLLEKLIDVAVSLAFLSGLSLVAIASLALRFMESADTPHLMPGYLENIIPFALVMAVVFLFYFTFAPRMRLRYLAIGALVTTIIWFAMRPAFHLFLDYNPGYGYAFGSFKSLFVVIIWIYVSLVIFLYGAEVAQGMNRKETVFIRCLMEGDRNVPTSVMGKYVARYGRGCVIFNEGDPGEGMFSVLSGRVGIFKNEKVIAEIAAGKCFGEMSFLLAAPRVAAAVALEDTELVSLNDDNIRNLMSEFPEFVVSMLRDLAIRLRETNKLID
ncbi:MAG TPA: YhjD/YihY/BrkB family envelope integrity protein [Nitrospirota bacterium]